MNSAPPRLRLGVDVGGTNTDAVAVAGRRVLASTKVPTSEDVTAGIVEAVRSLAGSSDVELAEVAAVMIGTTHFTNAIVEGRGLTPVAAVRLGLPATRALPPLVDWPDRLRRAIGGQVYLCHGGSEFDGRDISSLDLDELKQVGADIARRGITSIAITAVFAPLSPRFELEAAEVLAAQIPGAMFSLSSDMGRIGLLERENATIMNACLRGVAEHTVDAFAAALGVLGISTPFFISQNDGTVMNADAAKRFPVATFASGPSDSIRGAALLSDVDDAIVVDVGGTTTDIGAIDRGFPRAAPLHVDVAGVRTNFRMPDIVSLPVGGGTVVTRSGDEITIGPGSVGYRLSHEGRVFGGRTVTLTDVSVAAGLVSLGDARLVRDLDRAFVEDVVDRVQRTVADGVDAMKLAAGPVPVVLVGGGSILVRNGLSGAAELIRPDHFAVANAIGAALAEVGGEVDRIFDLDSTSRDQALAVARAEAIERAVSAGAAESSVSIVEIDEIPLAYLPGRATRIRMKAIGQLLE